MAESKREAIRFTPGGRVTIPFFRVGAPAYSTDELTQVVSAVTGIKFPVRVGPARLS